MGCPSPSEGRVLDKARMKIPVATRLDLVSCHSTDAINTFMLIVSTTYGKPRLLQPLIQWAWLSVSSIKESETKEKLL